MAGSEIMVGVLEQMASGNIRRYEALMTVAVTGHRTHAKIAFPLGPFPFSTCGNNSSNSVVLSMWKCGVAFTFLSTRDPFLVGRLLCCEIAILI